MMERGATLIPVARPAGLREQVYDRLRGAILTGELAPGTPMIEAEVATRLGASRTPVREALRRLESDGLIVPRGLRGTVVRTVEPAEVTCVFEIRAALEALAARRAAGRVDEANLDDLQADLDAMERALDDPGAFERADTTFHDDVVRAAGAARLARMLNDIRDETIAYRFLSLRDPERREETLAEHAAILVALRRRDSDAAAHAMSRHIANAGAVVHSRAEAGGS